MTTQLAKKLRACPTSKCTSALFAVALTFYVGGCSSRKTYTSTSSSEYGGKLSNNSSSTGHGYNSNATSANASTQSYNANSGASYNSNRGASTSGSGSGSIDSPLTGRGGLNSEQFLDLNMLLVKLGATPTTAEEITYVNQKLAEDDERPTLRQVAQVVIQYRIDRLQEARAARIRELQRQQQAWSAPPPSYGRAPQGSSPQMYRGLSDSEKQAIWSRELPRDTQEERKAKVEPYSQNSNNE